MSKLEDYSARAAESLAACNAAGNERDRAFHSRAHSVWRRLIANLAAAEARAVLKVPPQARKAPINSKPPTQRKDG